MSTLGYAGIWGMEFVCLYQTKTGHSHTHPCFPATGCSQALLTCRRTPYGASKHLFKWPFPLQNTGTLFKILWLYVVICFYTRNLPIYIEGNLPSTKCSSSDGIEDVRRNILTHSSLLCLCMLTIVSNTQLSTNWKVQTKTWWTKIHTWGGGVAANSTSFLKSNWQNFCNLFWQSGKSLKYTLMKTFLSTLNLSIQNNHQYISSMLIS